ncbi:hypothetical protein E5676_scaffold142G004220 [Cucumis melo var. makuwa]|uniref:Uncharacterized protein n=1 Tax=Cucumis melo var. makuwa TaxID=1194695 RepID=A0A5A7TE32_CUCMM|nr:hypothetical protein E6C27_scaffold460G00510 [Cucumis melo var. makuwa]TYK23358.1 hypothetical protein E5676_scaffold142G004220 [Cucumis melo var. makuwa]
MDNQNDEVRLREAQQGVIAPMISNMEALTDRFERLEIENRARERMSPPPSTTYEEEVVGEFTKISKGELNKKHLNFERNMGAIKFKIPKFFGKTDLKEYIQWEKKVENVFACHNFTDEQKEAVCSKSFLKRHGTKASSIEARQHSLENYYHRSSAAAEESAAAALKLRLRRTYKASIRSKVAQRTKLPPHAATTQPAATATKTRRHCNTNPPQSNSQSSSLFSS